MKYLAKKGLKMEQHNCNCMW